jgi:hypothetical protein
MEKIFYLLLLLSTTAIAQTKPKAANVFNCAEINFWQKQITTNFKDVKLVEYDKEGFTHTYSSRIPYGFDSIDITNDGKSNQHNKIDAYKLFETKKEALAFFTKNNAQLKACLTAQKYKDSKLEDDGYGGQYNHYGKAYGTKGGNIQIVLSIEPQNEVVNDKITDKIEGYKVSIDMDIRMEGSAG